MRPRRPAARTRRGRRRGRSAPTRPWLIALAAALVLAAAVFWGRRRWSRDRLCGSFQECLAAGRRLRGEEKYARAEAAYREAIRLNPQSFDGERELGTVLIAQRRERESIPHLEAAARLGPGNAGVYNDLAQVYLSLGEYDEAKKCLDGARKARANDSYVRQGYAGMNAGDDAGALATFEKAAAANPGNPIAYHHLGQYFLDHGRMKEAERYLRKALELFEKNPVTYSLHDKLHTIGVLSNCLSRQRRNSEAEALLSPLIERARDGTVPGNNYYSWLSRNMGDIESGMGHLPEAERFYKQAAAACAPMDFCSDKETAWALLKLAEFYMGHERESDARAVAAGPLKQTAFREVAEILNDNGPVPPAVVLSEIAALDLRLGMLPDAARIDRWVRHAYARLPLSPHLATAEMNLAQIREKQNRFGEAEKLLGDAIRIFKASRLSQEESRAREILEAVRQESAASTAAEDVHD